MKPVRLCLLIATLWVALAGLVFAADLGGITGRVTDKRTGHAIPFASVSIPLAKRGGLTDSEGQFSLTGIAPGTYEVKVQYLGYKPGSQTGVVVVAGKAVTVNFAIEDVVVREEKAIEVSAERRLVEVKQGTTVRSVNANEIRNMAVTTVGDLLQQQAGISTDADQIHIRGGRADETVFVVNGVANRDLVTGESTAGQLNARSVAEVNVATGAYDVRYGNALSGVVEIKLKEGTDQRQTGLTTATGSAGGRMAQFVSSGPDRVFGPLFKLLHVPAASSVTSVFDLSGSLSETRYSYLGKNPSLLQYTLAPPVLHPELHSSYEDSFFGSTFKYPGWLSPSEDNRWAARYGLTWKPDDQDKLTASFAKRIAIDQGFSRTFLTANGDQGDPAFPWQWSHRIGHAATIFEDNDQTSLQWRRTLSTTGFTEAQVSRYFFAQRQDVNGMMWGDYQEPSDISSFPVNDPRRSDYFIDTGDYYQWSDRRTTSYGLNWDITQRLHHNEFEAGFEHQWQTVQYLDIEYPWDYDVDGLGSVHDLWVVHPWIGDLFLRDRLEFEGFSANIGLRGDYWVVGREAEQALADTSRQNVSALDRTTFFTQTNSFFGRRAKVHWAPRVIVAHPISDKSSFFFNYGEFTQIPSYRYVYSKLRSISSESFPIQGNPNLNPEVSVNYEVGAKDQFLPTAALNLTFFVKDVYDYPSATYITPSSGSSIQPYYLYENGHFARSKGFEIELEKRRSHHWSGKLSYSYQQTKGKDSNPTQDVSLQELGALAASRLSEVYVTWNRPHKLSASLDFRWDDDAPRHWGILKHLGANVFMQGQSGRAFTPYDLAGINPVGLPSSENAPFQVSTDLKLDRWFKAGGRKWDVSLQGNNVFNNLLIYRIDSITGQGYVWGKGSFDPTHVSGLNNYTYQSRLEDPSDYGPGAQWRLQIDVDF